jgi:hypothetical protein
MNKDLKSFFSVIGIFLLYLYATVGIIKLLWNTKDGYMFEGRVKFISIMMIVFSFIYIISIYHIVGPYNVGEFYKVFIGFHFAYLFIGTFSNLLIRSKS